MRIIRSWFWYGIGHYCSKKLEQNEFDRDWCERWYSRYNRAMSKSVTAQGNCVGSWYPWEEPK